MTLCYWLGVILSVTLCYWLGVLLSVTLCYWLGVILSLNLCYWLGVILSVTICYWLGVMLSVTFGSYFIKTDNQSKYNPSSDCWDIVIVFFNKKLVMFYWCENFSMNWVCFCLNVIFLLNFSPNYNSGYKIIMSFIKLQKIWNIRAFSHLL